MIKDDLITITKNTFHWKTLKVRPGVYLYKYKFFNEVRFFKIEISLQKCGWNENNPIFCQVFRESYTLQVQGILGRWKLVSLMKKVTPIFFWNSERSLSRSVNALRHSQNLLFLIKLRLTIGRQLIDSQLI